MDKVKAFSTVSASTLGGVASNFVMQMDEGTLQVYLLSLIPAGTIFLAFIFKIIGQLGSLSFVESLMKSVEKSNIKELIEILENPHSDEETKKMAQQEINDMQKSKMQRLRKKNKAIDKEQNKAFDSLANTIDKGLKNPELQKALDKEN